MLAQVSTLTLGGILSLLINVTLAPQKKCTGVPSTALELCHTSLLWWKKRGPEFYIHLGNVNIWSYFLFWPFVKITEFQSNFILVWSLAVMCTSVEQQDLNWKDFCLDLFVLFICDSNSQVQLPTVYSSLVWVAIPTECIHFPVKIAHLSTSM